jgi:hypothetical protein
VDSTVTMILVNVGIVTTSGVNLFLIGVEAGNQDYD